MLSVVTAKAEIKKCQNRFVKNIKNHLKNKKKMVVGFHGGSLENDIYFNKELWFSGQTITDVGVPRYWNAFGLQINQNTAQSIVVEINPQIEGKNKSVAGLFGRDDKTGEYFLLHRGKVGGGRKGIGKSAFRDWHRGDWLEVECEDSSEEAILLGNIESPQLIKNITKFTQEVDKFKKEVSSGKLSRTPPLKNKAISFSPEFRGKKKGHSYEVGSYSSNHGLVVDGILEFLRTELGINEGSIFNNQFIDIGVMSGKRVTHIFEVKTSTDRQSIYTGIGQLMFHSCEETAAIKTLVLPAARNKPGELEKYLHNLGIAVMYFEVKQGKVKLMA